MKHELYYTYYKPVISKEHMLYAKEIADKFNIHTHNNTLASRFISDYLQTVCKSLDDYEPIFYLTKNGPAKVYPSTIYNPAIKALKSKVPANEFIDFSFNNKCYKIYIKE